MTSLERGRFFPTGFLPFLDVLVPVRMSFLSVETVSSFFSLSLFSNSCASANCELS
jgi:hypothetical protein